ncbi:MAG TPA: glycosyltransferase family 2 protein [Thermoanaerobaculia bacterium]|jgi:rSAM/selenodomain-associated transferase 2
MVTVVIAALNEEERVAAAVRSAFDAGASEVIVVDGGSRDATAARAAEAGARVLLSEPMRAKQLNLGAQVAANDKIIFLHADTLLPLGSAEAVLADFGGFRIAFAERSLRLRIAAFLINLRTRITKQPWGDQAQFVDRRSFPGFREIPIMEDYDLARRMKRGTILPLTVVTSGRRFLRKGVLRTAFINWTTILRYHLGADMEELARRYRK